MRESSSPYTQAGGKFPAEAETDLDASAVANKDVMFQRLQPAFRSVSMVPTGLSLARIRVFVLAALIALFPSAAFAAVEISFFSKEFGASFPHAFVALEGSLDETGEKIEANYGFTATHVTPAVLLGSVRGEVMSVGAVYLSKSDRHFKMTLSDEEYRQVMATVERWRTMKQPSYNLNRQNCVFFVAHVAAALGMTADTPKALMKKPRSYLQALTEANRSWLQARSAQFAQR
jgi:hypothetical protein